MSEPSNPAKRPFLSSPLYLPLARAVFCFFGLFVIFGLVMMLEQVEPRPLGLLKVAFALFVICLASAFGFMAQYGWRMFSKGGWREEHRRYSAQFEPPKQPWDKE